MHKNSLFIQTFVQGGFSELEKESELRATHVEKPTAVEKRNPKRRSNKKNPINTVNLNVIQTNINGYTSKKACARLPILRILIS